MTPASTRLMSSQPPPIESIADADSEVHANPQFHLILRVQSGAEAGKTLRITTTSCTIGPDKGCTLRIPSLGPPSIHCIILRNDTGHTIQSIYDQASVNGKAVSKSVLKTSDVIAIGGVEFLVVSAAPSVHPETAAGPAVSTAAIAAALSPLAERIDRMLTRIDELTQHTDSVDQVQESVEQVLSDRMKRIDELQAALSRAETDGRKQLAAFQKNAEQTQAELQNELNQARQSCRQLETDVQSVEKKLAEATKRRATLEERIDEYQKLLIEKEEARRADRKKVQEQLNAAHEQIVSLRNEVQRLRSRASEGRRTSTSTADPTAVTNVAPTNVNAEGNEASHRLSTFLNDDKLQSQSIPKITPAPKSGNGQKTTSGMDKKTDKKQHSKKSAHKTSELAPPPSNEMESVLAMLYEIQEGAKS